MVHASDSLSTQEYTPFEGLTLDARVVHTFLRGQQIVSDGSVIGEPKGEYLRRA